jgi:hypothetical protein
MNKCIWCYTKGYFTICPKCKSEDMVVDMDAKHDHHWSRKTINSVECKQCEKVISWQDYAKGNRG